MSAPVDLAVEVWPVNHDPVAVNDEAATTADVPIGLMLAKLVGNDMDADGDLLTFELLGTVTEQRGTVDLVGEVVVYVPDPNLVGTDSFRYRITDPYGGWAEGAVVVTVRASATPARTIVSVTPAPDGSVTVKLLGIPNRTYTVQWSFDLSYWSYLMQTKAGPTGGIEFVDRPNDEYGVRLISINDLSDLPTLRTRFRTVIVARYLPEHTLHFRVFDSAGTIDADKSESDFPGKSAEIADLKELVSLLWEEERLSTQQEFAILGAVSSILGHRASEPARRFYRIIYP